MLIRSRGTRPEEEASAGAESTVEVPMAAAPAAAAPSSRLRETLDSCMGWCLPGIGRGARGRAEVPAPPCRRTRRSASVDEHVTGKLRSSRVKDSSEYAKVK